MTQLHKEFGASGEVWSQTQTALKFQSSISSHATSFAPTPSPRPKCNSMTATRKRQSDIDSHGSRFLK